MSDSHDNTTNCFEAITYNNLCTLLNTLQASNIPSQTHIQRLYAEQGQDFDSTLNILQLLDIVNVKGDELFLAINWSEIEIDERSRFILNRISRNKSEYQSELLNYLENFVLSDDQLIHKPKSHLRAHQSGIRNFLMELELVDYETETDTYFLQPQCIDLYADVLENSNRLSPEFRSSLEKQKDQLGFSAEQLILDYEIERVGTSHASKVKHISIDNAAAGYDIRSVTVSPDPPNSPRFIEVKAVPQQTYQFYWSKGERDTAERFGHWYYLYLLPVANKDSFDLSKLKVIANPLDTVLSEHSEWNVELDVALCSLPNQRQS